MSHVISHVIYVVNSYLRYINQKTKTLLSLCDVNTSLWKESPVNGPRSHPWFSRLLSLFLLYCCIKGCASRSDSRGVTIASNFCTGPLTRLPCSTCWSESRLEVDSLSMSVLFTLRGVACRILVASSSEVWIAPSSTRDYTLVKKYIIFLPLNPSKFYTLDL